jgi:ankyrin repeat protein
VETNEILLKHGASINAMDKDGNQPLHRAYERYHYKTMDLLISQGADVNGISNPGQTPLHTVAGGDKSIDISRS